MRYAQSQPITPALRVNRKNRTRTHIFIVDTMRVRVNVHGCTAHTENDMMIDLNKTYVRNATGAPVIVIAVEGSWVSFYKLHVNTRERIGSPVRERANKFLVRYC